MGLFRFQLSKWRNMDQKRVLLFVKLTVAIVTEDLEKNLTL